MMRSSEEPNEQFLSKLIPTGSISMKNAIEKIQKPLGEMLEVLYSQVKQLVEEIKELSENKNEEEKGKLKLYQNESLDLMLERWAKLVRDLKNTRTNQFDVSKIPDVYDSIKYDAQHNSALALPIMDKLYESAKLLADLVIPQEYGITNDEKLNISHGYCVPLLRKILADLQANIDNPDENVNRLNPNYNTGVLSPGRHVRTRLYFTSESHIHSLLTILRCGGLCNDTDDQWARALDYVSRVTELNYMTQIVIMLYEDPNKPIDSTDRFHVELHFSPGAKSHKDDNYPQGSGFRPGSKPNSRDIPSPRADSASPNQSESENSDKTQSRDIHSPNQNRERGLDSRTRTMTGSPISSAQHSPEEAARERTQSDEDLIPPGTSDNVRKFLEKSKPHRSCPGQSTKETISATRQASNGLVKVVPADSLIKKWTKRNEGIFSRGNFFAKTFLSKNANSGSLPNLNQSDDDAVDGYNLVPNIRPLETLHNSLSLNQITEFFDKIIRMDGLGNKSEVGVISNSETFSIISTNSEQQSRDIPDQSRPPLRSRDSVAMALDQSAEIHSNYLD
jgi:inositol hexakisphosphate/diphosphoinositol-pentakisphosphate kinase